VHIKPDVPAIAAAARFNASPREGQMTPGLHPHSSTGSGIPSCQRAQL
jgi:hypothetical protein